MIANRARLRGVDVARTEIFGPVLSRHEAGDLDLARRFRYNAGVAAAMAMFPFSGPRGSFFGDLHGQGRAAIHFHPAKGHRRSLATRRLATLLTQEPQTHAPPRIRL